MCTPKKKKCYRFDSNTDAPYKKIFFPRRSQHKSRIQAKSWWLHQKKDNSCFKRKTELILSRRLVNDETLQASVEAVRRHILAFFFLCKQVLIRKWRAFKYNKAYKKWLSLPNNEAELRRLRRTKNKESKQVDDIVYNLRSKTCQENDLATAVKDFGGSWICSKIATNSRTTGNIDAIKTGASSLKKNSNA